jgi:hypothetical protein
MIGPNMSFAPGGKSFEDAAPVKPGAYLWTEHLDTGVLRYYQMYLKRGQTLSIDFRTPDGGSIYSGNAGASIYNRNGQIEANDSSSQSKSTIKSIAWSPPTDGWIYFTVGNRNFWGTDQGSVYVIWVQ